MKIEGLHREKRQLFTTKVCWLLVAVCVCVCVCVSKREREREEGRKRSR